MSTPDTEATAPIIRTLPGPAGYMCGLTWVEFGPEGLWMCLRDPTVVQLRDYTDMTVLREYRVGGDSPSGLTYAGGVVVHGDFGDSVLRATDARDGRPLGSVRVSGRPT